LTEFAVTAVCGQAQGSDAGAKIAAPDLTDLTKHQALAA